MLRPRLIDTGAQSGGRCGADGSPLAQPGRSALQTEEGGALHSGTHTMNRRSQHQGTCTLTEGDFIYIYI